MIYQKVNILTLSDVNINNVASFEELVNNKYLESDKTFDDTFDIPYEYEYNKIVRMNKTTSISKIPGVFTDIEHWPKSTDLKCWTCGLRFNSTPVFIPTYIKTIDITPESRKTEIVVFGNMCSFNCAELWIETSCNQERKYGFMNNLLVLFYIYTGKRVDKIKPSPNKTDMISYGGNLTKEEFREEIKKLDPIKYAHSPFINRKTKQSDDKSIWDMSKNDPLTQLSQSLLQQSSSTIHDDLMENYLLELLNTEST
jgi:hypothetical protein